MKYSMTRQCRMKKRGWLFVNMSISEPENTIQEINSISGIVDLCL